MTVQTSTTVWSIMCQSCGAVKMGHGKVLFGLDGALTPQNSCLTMNEILFFLITQNIIQAFIKSTENGSTLVFVAGWLPNLAFLTEFL